ncbi:hypothetical protein CUZ56_00309 [Saezia sanguinis]|uniref:Uncharacterized protein n=1 Tax=Saezia sanguinis TaxID=1965230 RepID=A0A433SGF2_9BURK|nr:hypothetical protein [Saezia sanguinis]RUS67829.1 hypothetical protein CUZ56_00309 [Saezia sanguinis]
MMTISRTLIPGALLFFISGVSTVQALVPEIALGMYRASGANNYDLLPNTINIIGASDNAQLQFMSGPVTVNGSSSNHPDFSMRAVTSSSITVGNDLTLI